MALAAAASNARDAFRASPGELMTKPPRLNRGLPVVAVCVFIVAFVVRLEWILRVQSPLDAVYSDMGGYVDRAQLLLAHKTPADPRVLSIYPPGTHSILALEFLIFGRDSRLAIAIVHALVGAVPAPCMALLTVNLVPSVAAAAIVGTLVALWCPQVAFVGFFSSEVWFSAAIAVHACLTVRGWRSLRGQLTVGVVAALAFVIRPQFLLTWLLELGARALRLVWRKGPAGASRSLVWLVVPMALMVAETSVRFHRLSGHWGLIAATGDKRLWADTDVCKISSTWQTPNGETWSYWFNPPSKPPHKPSDSVSFTGFIMDPVILERIRRERLRGVSWRKRLERKLGNIKLLVAGNLPWPESNYRDPPWRGKLQDGFADTLLSGVLPLAALGLALGRRNRTLLIVAANLTTIIVSGAIFFGEARYNIPYAPFALLLAVAGVYELVTRARRFVRRRLAARRRAAPRYLALPAASAPKI
jgi:hypothetical protein